MKKKPLVIALTTPYDIHASAVREGVLAYGGEFRAIYPCLFPYQSQLSYRSQQNAPWQLIIDGIEAPTDGEYVFWNRRRGKIQKMQGLVDADVGVAADHSNRLLDSASYLLSHRARLAINDYRSFMAAESSKALQLALAQECGLQIPDTLISNDPGLIRATLDGGVRHSRWIGKSLGPAVWNEGGTLHLGVTAFVDRDELPNDNTLRSGPVVLQRAVKKRYEIRANVMGGFVQAVRIDSPDPNDSDIDWRPNQEMMKITPCKLPARVELQLVSLVKKLNLNFGACDLIVDDRDRHIFLEVNQMGQFLWLEEMCPEVKVLDAFCRFCISGDPNFDGSSRSMGLSLHEIRETAWQWNLHEGSKHGFSLKKASEPFSYESER